MRSTPILASLLAPLLLGGAAWAGPERAGLEPNLGTTLQAERALDATFAELLQASNARIRALEARLALLSSQAPRPRVEIGRTRARLDRAEAHSLRLIRGYEERAGRLKRRAAEAHAEGRRTGDRAGPDVVQAGSGPGQRPTLAADPGVGAGDVIRRLFDETPTEPDDALPPLPDDGVGAVSAASSAWHGDDASRRVATARALIDVEGTADADDAALVAAELAKLPLAILEQLEAQGTTVAVCRNSITEVRTDLAGVRPRGWPPGTSWDDVPGQFQTDRNRVIIATRGHGTASGARVPPRGSGHSAYNLVLHETAHAVDQAGERVHSQTAAFVAARADDLSRLSAYEAQSGVAGPQETYAESFARYYGGDPTLAATRPALSRYWRSDPLAAEGG